MQIKPTSDSPLEREELGGGGRRVLSSLAYVLSGSASVVKHRSSTSHLLARSAPPLIRRALHVKRVPVDVRCLQSRVRGGSLSSSCLL